MLDRTRTSFRYSVGSIVFGMEDGTVSIFGLVFGVAASAPATDVSEVSADQAKRHRVVQRAGNLLALLFCKIPRML
jgi:hypothetical protein